MNTIPYYHYYIKLVKEDDVLQALNVNQQELIVTLQSIPENKWNYSYAPGKWTIKQLLCHIIDTERIFAYRALRFSRGDNSQLPPFDENLYVENAPINTILWQNLIAEFNAVRQSTIFLYQGLQNDHLLLKGKLEAGETDVLSIGYTICGHGIHHIEVLKSRYL